MTINRVKRYIAGESMREGCLATQRAIHHHWRATNVFKGGMTEKEIAYVEKRMEVLKRISEDLYKLHRKLQNTGRCT